MGLEKCNDLILYIVACSISISLKKMVARHGFTIRYSNALQTHPFNHGSNGLNGGGWLEDQNNKEEVLVMWFAFKMWLWLMGCILERGQILI